MKNHFATMFALVTLITVGVSAADVAPTYVRPWDDGLTSPDVGRPQVTPSTARGTAGLQDGADHIVSQQCGNGGFGWPHADCGATYNNITAPICLGVLDAYAFTADGSHLASTVAGGDYDLTSQYGNGESRFGTGAPYFLWRLTQATSDAQYSNFAATDFFDELTAATYGPSDLDTAGWIASVQAGRAGTWINLLPWEFQTLPLTATAIGNAGQDALFVQAILDGLNTLDNTSPFTVYSDLIGLAGGVRGLALSGTTSFAAINSPNHAPINGITTLEDLANTLVGFQNGNGSWYWHSDLGAPGASDEDTQTTAYAVMALLAADPLVATNYTTEIQAARTWINGMQLISGGFLSYPGGDENTEVEGEALSAVATSAAAIPAVSEWGLVIMVLAGLALGTGLFRQIGVARPS